MAKISRGDVVVTRIPLGGPAKLRPFVVVQNDQNNARLTNVILAMVTSNTKLVSKVPTQVLVELTTTNKPTGLSQTSAIKCENLYTVPRKTVRRIGHLPASLMGELDAALKASLALT